MSSPVKLHSVAEQKRALFTVGLISKHFDFVDIVTDAVHVCILLGVYYFDNGHFILNSLLDNCTEVFEVFV